MMYFYTFTKGVVIAIVIGVLTLFTPPQALAARDILIPSGSNTVWHGVFLPQKRTISASQITTFENQADKKIAAEMYYVGWYINAWDSVQRQINVWEPLAIKTHVVWEPNLKGNKNNNTLDAILNGSQDGVITDFARKAKTYGKPFFLRFAHEMNGNWYEWSGARTGRDPQKYIDAWRYVWNKFQEEGTTNAIWVWSPNAWNVPNESWNDLRNYYPGDQYVDWVGVDFFGLKFDSVEPGVAMDQVYTHYSHKPIMVSETAAADCNNYISAATMTKDQWINKFFEALAARPAIRAFFWFNPAAQNAYRSGVSSARFITR